ncbi:MAG: glycoside hydrolase family 2 protein [Candidatus Cyclobacteriaceae bacterium M3_2C_046]
MEKSNSRNLRSISAYIFTIIFILSFASFGIGQSSIPRPEHPRPQFVRDQWINLNGTWDFAMDLGQSGLERKWYENPDFDQQIVVPYPPESKLSGIEHKGFMPVVWYHRTFTIPAEWQDDRVFLNFGGVDYECRAWVNGQEIGRHYGGSVSFSFEVTEQLKPGENELVVMAVDEIRSNVQPAGKQSETYYNNGCCKYTRVTGIWQTVWLEARPNTFIEQVKVVPDLDNSRFIITPLVQDTNVPFEFTATLTDDKGKTAGAGKSFSQGIPAVINLKNPRAWSPDDPYLYDLNLTLKVNGVVVDQVKSYAGLRKIHLEDHKVMLNNQPIFLRLVLDQGFYPDGIWTAPTDQDLKGDIEKSMAVGFNGARLHEKVFEERFHYWADKLGYLTWGEYPDWGVSRTYKDPMAWLNLVREWREVIQRDMNHPSIITWTPMNETHSPKQGYEAYRRAAEEIYQVTRQMDPTRPVNETSGFLHIVTDIYTVHDYDQKIESWKEKYVDFSPEKEDFFDVPWGWYGKVEEYKSPYEGQPYVVDEYGGTFWIPAYADQPARGNGRSEWGYGKSADQVEDLIEDLTLVLLNNPYIAGYTYTQLTDVEQEVNGIYTFDRELKFDQERLKNIFGAPAAIEQQNQ